MQAKLPMGCRTMSVWLCTAALVFGIAPFGRAQVIGSSDNFDCFNDTGEEAEGFEIDVEDVATTDLTREFPSNFSTTPWVIRYGLPTVTAYDFTHATPDPQHNYDAGHKGVLITWAAAWNGKKWIAQYGNQPFGTTLAGNGTRYNPKPTYTNGDSCWYYGLGAAYPKSGCDHFGISFIPTAAIGKIAYHWKVADPNNLGVLTNAAAEASIPGSPTLAPAGGQNGVINAVAEAPDNAGPQWGPAYFVRVTTLYSPAEADLDQLQKANVKNAKTKKFVTYSVLQRPPAGVAGEKDDVENDQVGGKNVSVTKQYEYFVFNGSYDGETHEAVCDSAYKTEQDAINGTNAIASGDSCSLAGHYWVINSYTDLPVYLTTNFGAYVGAHINAYNNK